MAHAHTGSQTGPHTRRTRKDWRESSQVGRLYEAPTKQEDSHTESVLGSPKMNSSPHSPSRTLKDYVEPWTESSHAYRPGGLNNTLLSCPWNSSHHGKGGQNVPSEYSGGGVMHPVSRVQFWGRHVIMSSWWWPPTACDTVDSLLCKKLRVCYVPFWSWPGWLIRSELSVEW